MKKLLIFIFSIFFGLISFSSSESYELVNDFTFPDLSLSDNTSYTFNGLYFFGSFDCHFWDDDSSCSDEDFDIGVNTRNSVVYFDSPTTVYLCNLGNLYPDDYGWCLSSSEIYFGEGSFPNISGGGSSSDIKVNYNNGSFTTVSCDGVNEITINGLSTQNSSTTFTPFFNISYIDEDNQNLIESYDKDLLYLSGGQFHKTYTGDNQWILNLVGGSSNTGGFNIISSGLVVSGDMVSDNLSGNMFKSFIDTGFTVLFSNIPSYIQYVILIVILIVILRVFTKKRRKI